MRLTCPNCEAEYEVGDGLVPTEGRDVQCSNCGKMWFQAPADEDEALPMPVTASASASGAVFKRPTIDPSALDVIHEEVALETEARDDEENKQVKAVPAIETDPIVEPGTDERIRAYIEETIPPTSVTSLTEQEADLSPAPLRAPTEDPAPVIAEEIVEKISAELSEGETHSSEDVIEEIAEQVKAKRGGFGFGFVSMMILAAVALGAYLFAQPLAQNAPSLAEPLETYVALVDIARVWLADLAADLSQKLKIYLAAA